MTQDKDQILTELKDIINESFEAKTSYKGPKLGLKRHINDMITESDSNPEVMKSLEEIDTALNEGKVTEAQAIVPLLEKAKLFAKYIPGISKVQEALEATARANSHEIVMTCLLEGIQSPSVRSYIEPAWTVLMESGTMESRANLETILESCAPMDNAAAEMLSYVRSYKIDESVKATASNVLNESSAMSPEETAKAELLAKMSAYVDSKLAESNAPAKKSFRDIDNDIRLMETIQTLKGEVKNEKFQSMLSLYEQALNDGCMEEMICETFLQKLDESKDYWDAVYKAEEAMRERITSHKESIDLSKLMETMANDGTWSYLVPVVEDVVIAYAEDPNVINRSVLTNHLRMYDSCPYVRDILSIANEDNSKDGLLMKESKQFIAQRAHIEDVWSPVQYIKENECIFNVEDQFYVKKGNNISKLSKDSAAHLSESFLALAKIINMPNVEINEAEDCIDYWTETGDLMKVYEGKVMVGGDMETPSTLKKLDEMHVKHSAFTDINFLTAAFLCESFNSIAKVDFAKKIVMNESDDKTLDLFKIKKNIYVAAHDNINEEHTFYRNVKPLQLKGIMNDHFGIEVSNLFEDMLPNQDRIVENIEKIKAQYEDKIDRLMEMKERLEEQAENTTSDNAHILEQAVVKISQDIKEAKAEYMKFQKRARLVEEIDPSERVDNILDTASDSLQDTDPSEFDDAASINAVAGDDEDFDGSDDVNVNDGSDYSIDGSDNGFNEDIDDGSDFSFGELDFDLDGSDDEDLTSSDGDVMSQPITGDEEYSTSVDADIDDTDELSQSDTYNLDDKLDFHDSELDAEGQSNETAEPDIEGAGEAGEESPEDFDLSADAEDDPFGADTEGLGPDEDMAELDADASNEENIAGNDTTDEVDDDADLDYANFKIVKIDFDVNVRTGERKNTGKAIVIVPMVDAEGNKTSDTKNIDFYVTEIKGEKAVVLDSEGLTLEMYNAVCDAIKKTSDFSEVEALPNEVPGDDDIDSVDITEEEPVDDGAASAEGEAIDINDDINDDPDSDPTDGDGTGEDVFDSGSDETTVLTIDDNIEPHGVDISSISDEDEGAGEADGDIPGDIFDEIPEGKKAPKGKKLNESMEDADDNGEDEGTADPDEKLLIAEDQDDPIAVIKEVLDAYAENGGDCQVGDINDYDVDGKEVNTIQATIGSNDYTFFTLYEDIYCALTQDFDANSQTIEDLEDWCRLDEDDDDAPIAANVEIAEGDTQAWVDFVTDIIATETGDQLDYELEDQEEGDQVVEEPIDEAARVRVNPKKN